MDFVQTVGFSVNVAVTCSFLIVAVLYFRHSKAFFNISAGCFIVAVVGSVLSVYLYDIDKSWHWWLLFSATTDLMKYLVVKINEEKASAFSITILLLKVTMLLNVTAAFLEHIDYAVIETEMFYGEYSTITKTINVLFAMVLASPLLRFYWLPTPSKKLIK